MKTCRKCGVEKSLDEFSNHRQHRDGKSSTCKSCDKISAEKYRRNNADKIKKSRADHYQRNKEELDAKNRAWAINNPVQSANIKRRNYEKNKDRYRESNKTWEKNNKPKIAEKNARYYLQNKAHIKERNDLWALNNRDKNNAKSARWRKNNPEKFKEQKARRRAEFLQRTPPWLTVEHFREIRSFYKTASELSKSTGIIHEVDHIVPLKGKCVSGLHVPWNLQILTAKQNRLKHNKHEP